MGKTRTVKAAMATTYQVVFPEVDIARITRFDPAAGSIDFHAQLSPSQMERLFAHFEWEVPGEKSSLDSYDGKLEGGRLVFTSKDKLKDAEVELPYIVATGFACHRLNLKGRKKKGFRRELRFKVTFDATDACAKLEGYMMTVGAHGELKLYYIEQPEQVPLIPSDAKATDEQRQGVLGKE